MATLTNGLHTDNSPLFQPKGSYRFALNAVNSNDENGEYILGIEKGTEFVTTLVVTDPDYDIPVTMTIIGKVYIDNSQFVLFTVSEDNAHAALLLFDANEGNLSLILSDFNNNLEFDISHPVSAVYRLKNGCDKIIYWTDNKNNVRTMVLGKEEDYLTEDYKLYNKGIIYQLPYLKYDVKKFDLQKFYSVIPKFESIKVISGGRLKPGSYNFAIQYVDKSNNPTEWITISQPILIYDKNTNSDYNSITGDIFDEKDNVIFGKKETSKAIEIAFGNFDSSYPYYRIAVIEATEGTGKPNKVLMSARQSTNNKKFIYDGNIESYELISKEEISLFTANIGKVESILQLDNRLLLANTESKKREYCSYQRLASKIKTEYVTKLVPASIATSLGNDKNPNTLWLSAMGGEVYALGIVYVFEDGTSPVYHIPGRPVEQLDREIITGNDADNVNGKERWEVYNTADSNGKMAYYEIKSHLYTDKTDCNGNSYWGKDYAGNDLANTPIRHHKFPNRKIVPLHVEGDVNALYNNRIRVMIEVTSENIYNSFSIYLQYDVVDNTGTVIETVDATINVTLSNVIDIYHNEFVLSNENRMIANLRLNPDYPNQVICSNTSELLINNDSVSDCSCTGNACFPIASLNIASSAYSEESTDGYINLIGVKFSNIELPEGAIGYYIVRGKRDMFNRQVISKAYSGKTRKSSKYIGFMGLVDVDDTDSPQYSSDFTVSEDYYSLISPDNLFLNRDISASYLKSEGFFKKIHDIGETHTDIVQDVAGTKTGMFDKDGFDWQGGVRGYYLGYDADVTEEHNYKINKSIELGAVSKKTQEQYNIPETSTTETRTLYNCSYDNKIYLVNLDRKYSRTNETLYKQGVEYVALMNNTDVHPILSEIEYIKLDPNIHTEDTIESFGFDTRISTFNPSYSTYQGLSEHHNVLGFIVAAVAIVAAAVVSIASLGTLSGLAAVGAALVVASAMAKITAEAIQTFSDDYINGNLAPLMKQGYPIQNENDTMLVAGLDFYKGLYVETDINIGLRVGSNSKVTDFLRNPTLANAKEYIKNKWLVVQEDAPIMDKDSSSNSYNYNPSGAQGKMVYRGVPCAEVYKINLDYSRPNAEKKYYPLPYTYECCSSCIEKFPNRIYYSEKSFQEEGIDNYRTILPLNYIDIPGEHSEITKIFSRNNALFVLTPSSLWLLPKNVQERVTGDYLSLVGTGGYFNVDPRIVKDSEIGSGGTTQIHSLIKSDYGIIYVSDYDKQIYLLDYSNRSGVAIKSINNGISKWLYYNMDFELEKQISSKSGWIMKDKSNHYTLVGYHMAIDYENDRLLITKKDYKVKEPFYVVNNENWIDKTELSTEESSMFESDAIIFNVSTNQFYTLSENTTTGNYILNYTMPGDSSHFIDKSWTLSYSFKTGKYISFHSYLSNVYLFDKKNLFSLSNHLPKDDEQEQTGSRQLWRHNADNLYRYFYGVQYPFIIEYVGVQNPVQTTIVDNIVFNTKAIEDGNIIENVTFTEAVLYNSKQCTGNLGLEVLNNDVDYMINDIKNTSNVLKLKKQNKDWYLSGFRDMVANNGKMWLDDDTSLENSWFIDKILNSAIFDNNLTWDNMPPMKDKYIIVRLSFFGYSTIHTNLLTNFIFEIENT